MTTTGATSVETSTSTADLNGLYLRYSARLTARAAMHLAAAGPDTWDAVDDVMQEVWLQAASLLRLPSEEAAWPVLTDMLDCALADHYGAPHRNEIPSGMEHPATRALPLAPLFPSSVLAALPATPRPVVAA